jgi:hypothetical protein
LALFLPAVAAATPPSGRVQIMNRNSGLCPSPAGGARDLNGQVVQ